MKNLSLKLFSLAGFFLAPMAFGKSIMMRPTQMICPAVKIGIEDISTRPEDIWRQRRGKVVYHTKDIGVMNKSLLTRFDNSEIKIFNSDRYDTEGELPSTLGLTISLTEYRILDESDYFGGVERTIAVKLSVDSQDENHNIVDLSPWVICRDITKKLVE